jgi:hypothetical protein
MLKVFIIIHILRLHLQFLLRFLVRFSPSDACEGVDELRMFAVHVPHLNIHNLPTRSHSSEKLHLIGRSCEK